MSERELKTFSLPTVIAWCAAVAVTCISGTYTFTDNQLKNEIKQYEKLSSWSLPTLLKDLGTVSEELKKNLVNYNEIERLRQFESEYKKEYDNLKNEVKALKTRLNSIEGESVLLGSSESVPLGEPGLLLGMETYSFGLDAVKLAVGNKKFSLGIAEIGDYQSNKIKYTFTYKGKTSDGKYEIIITRKNI